MDTKSVCVLVPAFNESSVVAKTVSDLRAVFDHIVVVDDGSADGTDGVAHAAGATVVRHAVNRGQGAALQTGFDYIRMQTGAEYCVTFDADGQHRVEDAVSMVQLAREHGVDVVLASRFARKHRGYAAVSQAPVVGRHPVFAGDDQPGTH